MYEARLLYLKLIDKKALELARDFINGKPISKGVLESIIEIYKAAKVEQHFKEDTFENAYHSPITGELEFLIARIFFHYSNLANKGWKIMLRRQENKTAPDIRLLKGGKTFVIIEVKAKAGWIQPFLSPERFAHDKLRLSSGKTQFDPDSLITNSRNQLKKYCTTFQITNDNVYLFLPTLALVHRKKYKTELEGYYNYFATTSGLPKENLILLSSNKRLDLSHVHGNLDPTNNFERMLNKISC